MPEKCAHGRGNVARQCHPTMADIFYSALNWNLCVWKIINIIFRSDIFCSDEEVDIFAVHATASVLRHAGQMELLYHPPTCLKSYSYKKTCVVPQEKGPYGPQVKIPFLPTTLFPLRTVKYTALNNKAKNNFNVGKIRFIMVLNTATLCAAKILYLISECFPGWEEKMSVGLLRASGYSVKS